MTANKVIYTEVLERLILHMIQEMYGDRAKGSTLNLLIDLYERSKG